VGESSSRGLWDGDALLLSLYSLLETSGFSGDGHPLSLESLLSRCGLTVERGGWGGSDNQQMISYCLKSVDFLQICWCPNLTSSSILHLSALPLLSLLSLSNLPVLGDDCLWALSALPLLCLRLNECAITDAGCKLLAYIHTLRVLEIVGNNVTNKGLRCLYSAIPHCRIKVVDDNQTETSESA
jgi:hypothetical protein